MRPVLDTHTFLWYIGANPQLPNVFRNAIKDPANQAYLSVASIWECVIKHALGKLPLPEGPAGCLPRQRESRQIESLPVDEGALAHLAALPPLNRDPFDRIIIAQAIQHGLILVTVDQLMKAYAVGQSSP